MKETKRYLVLIFLANRWAAQALDFISFFFCVRCIVPENKTLEKNLFAKFGLVENVFLKKNMFSLSMCVGRKFILIQRLKTK